MDLHVHTLNSPDAFMSVRLAARTALARGLDGLAITDHECRTDVEHLGSLAQEIVLLPGVEVRAGQYHLLGLGVDIWEQKRCETVREAVERVHAAGGLAVVAHPYLLPLRSPSWEALQEARVDALEVVNSSVQPFSLGTRLASRAASALRLPRTGGSDSHIPATIGNAYTLIDTAGREQGSVLDAVRRGRTEVYGRPTSLKHRLEKLMLQLQGRRLAEDEAGSEPFSPS